MFNKEKNYFVTGDTKLFQKAGNDLKLFKKLLKEFIETDESSYKNLTTSHKNKVLKMIDSITEKEFKTIHSNPKNLFVNEDVKQNNLEMLKNLANKLENAQKTGGKVPFN